MIASIIITTLNRANTLTQRSLKSALNQNFDDYEVIVVDDGSIDDTPKVMKNLVESRAGTTPRLRYYWGENRGLPSARNFGVKMAESSLVVCLDDDNELMPDFLKETTESIKWFDAVSVGRIVKYVEKNYEDYAHAYSQDENTKFISIDWGWLMKKEIFQKIQYDEKMLANEDADFGLQFTKAGLFFTTIDKPLSIAFDQEGDPKLSMSYPSKRILDGIQYFLDKNLPEYAGYPNELRYIYRLAGRRFYLGGQKKKGISYFWKSFRAMPRLETLTQLCAILLGWKVYDTFMTLEEKLASKLR